MAPTAATVQKVCGEMTREQETRLHQLRARGDDLAADEREELSQLEATYEGFIEEGLQKLQTTKAAGESEAVEEWTMAKVAGALSYLDSGSAWFARESVSAITSMVGVVADHTRSIAQEIAHELSDGTPMDAETRAAEEELVKAAEALPPSLVAYVKDLAHTPEVFLEHSTPPVPSFQVTDEMEYKARVILSACPDLSQLRYELCPRKMSDDRFWEVYFALVQNHQAGHLAKGSVSPERPAETGPERPVETGPWDCAFCTYHNEAGATCGMCGERRDAEVPSDRGQSQSQSLSPNARQTPDFEDDDGYFPTSALKSYVEAEEAE